MPIKQIVPGVYAVSLGPVNAFLLDVNHELTLIDTGIPGSSGKILEAVQSLGRRPEDVKQILVTHCHTDHSGSLAALKKATGAPAVMHPLDAALVRKGETIRPVKPAPGLLNSLIFNLVIKRQGPGGIEAAEVESEVEDGQVLAAASGIKAIHVPGHCAGQLAFLWPQHGGVLFAADTATNIIRLGYAPIYEDLEEGRRSLARLAGLDFEVACFGHGGAIQGGAAERFRQKWGARGAGWRPFTGKS